MKQEHKAKIRICLAASAGGHLTQLMALSESWKGKETFFVTTASFVKDDINGFGDVYVVGECNRQHPVRVLKVFLKCVKIVVKEKPDTVISTGAAAGCMICFLAKIFGAKIVWIDSITNVKKVSLSGRLVKHIADLFLVQWPDLAVKHKGIEYAGAVV